MAGALLQHPVTLLGGASASGLPGPALPFRLALSYLLSSQTLNWSSLAWRRDRRCAHPSCPAHDAHHRGPNTANERHRCRSLTVHFFGPVIPGEGINDRTSGSGGRAITGQVGPWQWLEGSPGMFAKRQGGWAAREGTGFILGGLLYTKVFCYYSCCKVACTSCEIFYCCSFKTAGGILNQAGRHHRQHHSAQVIPHATCIVASHLRAAFCKAGVGLPEYGVPS